MMITGIVAPPAAMVAKRSGQSVPQLSALKVIPDVIFVPTATILALIAVKSGTRARDLHFLTEAVFNMFAELSVP
ncbi:hypothetical protein L195_g019597 [Trifolium pratense]|uniref:Uncharacterized protein n=1 Tax=Trifolium pratense TaxID=57577 RepID=A0A2K3N020_TRIPR|nr:hypothetical protein L195_g019597 [Trifolium pratense]